MKPTSGRLPGSVPPPGWLISYRRALIRSDAVVVLLAVLVAEFGRSGGVARAVTGSPAAGFDWFFAVALVAWWLACLGAEGTWQLEAVGSGLTECRRIVRASVVVFAVVGIIGYLTEADLARGYLVIAVPLGAAGLLTNHLLRRRRLLRSREVGDRLLSVLVVGDRVGAAELCARLQADPRAGYRPIGVCIPLDRSELPGPVAGLPVRGDLDQVTAVALAGGANAVAVAESGLRAEQLSQLGLRLEGTGVVLLLAPGVADVAGPGARVQPVAGLPLLRISEPRLDGGRALLKTALDVVGSVFGIVLLSPFMLLALIAVPVGDGGPALSRREYVGRGGRVFHAWLFRCAPLGRTRSNRMGTATRGKAAVGDVRGADRATDNGRAFTAVGRILRRTGLDESPLLFGVLAGRLSLVGPEPGASGTADEVVRRPRVRPGITGPWRLAGIDSAADSVAADPVADFRYVQNWSLVGDVAMLAKTVSAVVSGRAPSWLRM